MINILCEKYGIKNYTINEDGSIDVFEDVYLNDRRLTKLPLKFRNVIGNFYCSFNKLTSLEGCPRLVDGNFNCNNNDLTSLEGSPVSVGGNFDCHSNQLTSLENSPKVKGHFNFSNNNIRSFEGLIQNFNCYNNPIYDIWKLFKNEEHIELLNDYNIFKDNEIILFKLNDFLEDIGKPILKYPITLKCKQRLRI